MKLLGLTIAAGPAKLHRAIVNSGKGVAMTVTLEEAQSRLPEIIDQMIPGESLSITHDNHAIAKLVKQAPPSGSSEPRRPGSAIGKLTIISEDDEHLDHFKEYMP